jgi:hypothetical protein
VTNPTRIPLYADDQTIVYPDYAGTGRQVIVCRSGGHVTHEPTENWGRIIQQAQAKKYGLTAEEAGRV